MHWIDSPATATPKANESAHVTPSHPKHLKKIQPEKGIKLGFYGILCVGFTFSHVNFWISVSSFLPRSSITLPGFHTLHCRLGVGGLADDFGELLMVNAVAWTGLIQWSHGFPGLHLISSVHIVHIMIASWGHTFNIILEIMFKMTGIDCLYSKRLQIWTFRRSIFGPNLSRSTLLTRLHMSQYKWPPNTSIEIQPNYIQNPLATLSCPWFRDSMSVAPWPRHHLHEAPSTLGENQGQETKQGSPHGV